MTSVAAPLRPASDSARSAGSVPCGLCTTVSASSWPRLSAHERAPRSSSRSACVSVDVLRSACRAFGLAPDGKALASRASGIGLLPPLFGFAAPTITCSSSAALLSRSACARIQTSPSSHTSWSPTSLALNNWSSSSMESLLLLRDTIFDTFPATQCMTSPSTVASALLGSSLAIHFPLKASRRSTEAAERAGMGGTSTGLTCLPPGLQLLLRWTWRLPLRCFWCLRRLRLSFLLGRPSLAVGSAIVGSLTEGPAASEVAPSRGNNSVLRPLLLFPSCRSFARALPFAPPTILSSAAAPSAAAVSCGVATALPSVAASPSNAASPLVLLFSALARLRPTGTAMVALATVSSAVALSCPAAAVTSSGSLAAASSAAAQSTSSEHSSPFSPS
mmetsp:Transcript_83551/g.270360  ORF Transcript_83551/g.270360 Transcript_83551/m.270360 type:complete len:390 (+) Transcript_83551:417-1586(+)